MPKMSGVDVCAALRANPSPRSIPVVLLTARTEESELEQGLASGADDYIVEPFSPREMLRRVEAVLAKVSPDR